MITDLTRRAVFGLGGGASLWGLGACGVRETALGPGDKIHVNQVGYLAHAPMDVHLQAQDLRSGDVVRFDLVNHESGAVLDRCLAPAVFSSEENLARATLTWGGTVQDVEQRVAVKSGDVMSLPFQLSRTAFDETQRVLTRALYLQRCGTSVSDAETGLVHSACHLDDAIAKSTGVARDCVGGWHDAGDFGKYVATTSVVIGQLLSLYEQSPSAFEDGALNIPRSGNGEPDLLSEMRIGLSWLLKMQGSDGAFSRKVAGNVWPPMKAWPEEDRQLRFVYGVSSADTARAGAALAIAARVFAPWDASAAKAYLAAAQKAWAWLAAHSEPVFEHHTGDNAGSGAYLGSDTLESFTDTSDRFWLALELYVSTGEDACREAIAAHVEGMYIWPVSWANPSLIGLLNFLRATGRDDVGGLRAEIEFRLIERANEFEKITRLSPWSAATRDFAWGSNREIASRGGVLIAAYERTGEQRFLCAALAQVNYIFGCNSTGLSFVTGTGINRVENPHHRIVLAMRKQGAKQGLPGLLVGGRNEDLSHGPRKGAQNATTGYRDDAMSWETNEFAIDYNAALIVLLQRLKASFKLPAPRPGA